MADEAPEVGTSGSLRAEPETALPPPSSKGEPVSEEMAAQLERVLQSDIGVSTLLTRLKQSIASARDFATFLRKRSTLEEEHSQGLKKLARTVHDSASRPDNRHGSLSQSCEDITRIHESMADHGLQFALSLHQMSEDLNELATNMERGRKHWKQNGLAAEKRVQDAEAMAEKAKSKYDSLAEQYDRVKTGDKQSGKFGLKGHKTAAQHEEETLRKVQNADSDYASKVQSAQSQRKELVTTLRPQAVRALKDLIAECDSGLSLQMQKFASFTEKLLLGKGLSVSPLKNGPNGSAASPKSLRESMHRVNNGKDFNDYILSHTGKVGSGSSELKYERHPTLGPTPQPANAPSVNKAPAAQPPPTISSPGVTAIQTQSTTNLNRPPLVVHNPDAVDSNPLPPTPQGPPQQYQAYQAPQPQPPPPGQLSQPKDGPQGGDLPPLNPVFGVSLQDLFQRDGTAIPMIVYQCLLAVDTFGLNVEGIYRVSGSANHVQYMKSMFDNDSSRVDFTNPENFYHDVNSVAGLLKQFFRELPDPLFTNERYADLINAARREDENQRRDTLHAIVNSLPDPNYATLRALVLHLNRVQEHSYENRMNAGNIAISFGLTLMGTGPGHNIADSGWQARVIETILQNTFQIFDDD